MDKLIIEVQILEGQLIEERNLNKEMEKEVVKYMNIRDELQKENHNLKQSVKIAQLINNELEKEIEELKESKLTKFLVQESLFDVARDYPRVRGKDEENNIDTADDFVKYVKWVLLCLGFDEEGDEDEKSV